MIQSSHVNWQQKLTLGYLWRWACSCYIMRTRQGEIRVHDDLRDSVRGWLTTCWSGRFCTEDTEESVASFSLGIRMHCKKAALFQRPRAWIVESSTPSRTAEVAAPIWKLAGIEVLWLACHVENATNFRYELALKNCPGLSPRMVITQNCSNWP